MKQLWKQTALPVDVEAAVQRLTTRLHANDPHLAPYYSRSHSLIAGRAPGRLDVMGGISDYSGSRVLQLPLQESTVVLAQRCVDPELRIISLADNPQAPPLVFCAPLQHFYSGGAHTPRSEQKMGDYFRRLGDEHQWAAYIAGVLSVLMLHARLNVDSGIVLFVSSSVPVGKGVSSSAALEVATMRSLCGLFDLTISAHQQAVLCQRVENLIVGAPCGLMDQMASSCGQEGALMNMLCQPDQIDKPMKLPDGLAVWGIDSGIRHAVSGADYGTVRVAAFMGYRYLLELAGIASGQVMANDIRDTRWRGYLANINVAELLQHFYAKLPEQVAGYEFLERFDATTDTVTSVDPDTQYAVRSCTAHPVQEHFRVQMFIQMANAMHMANATNRSACLHDQAILMGECMYQSHASYSMCGLGCEECDDLVARLRDYGAEAGIYGARITGGGSGGAIAILAKDNADSLIRSIAADYSGVAGTGGTVFSGSSAGASVHQIDPGAV